MLKYILPTVLFALLIAAVSFHWELHHLRGILAAKKAEWTRAVQLMPAEYVTLTENSLDDAAIGQGAVDQKARQRHHDALWADAEYVRLSSISLRGGLDVIYGSLFRRLQLPRSDLEELKRHLIEKQIAMGDARRVAREYGIPATEWPLLEAAAYREIDRQVLALLGDEKFQEYMKHHQSLPSRNRLRPLVVQLSAAEVPLEEAQMEALIGTLLDHEASEDLDNASLEFPESFISLANNILDRDQFDIFVQFQEQRAVLGRMAEMAENALE